jgi:hypothetical protein
MQKLAALVSLVVFGASSGTAAKDAPGAHQPHAFGTVAYDTGVPHAGLYYSFFHSVGNRFNSDMGGPLLMTGQLTRVTFWLDGILAGGASATVFGPPNSMGTAPNLGYAFLPGHGASYFQVASISPIATPPDFLLGIGLTSSFGIGMDDQSVGGQGFHAFQLVNHFQNPGTMFQAIPGRNALIRATGNILVPVELMKFTVE